MSTTAKIAEVPRSGAEDVDCAVEAAQAALPERFEKTPKELSELLHRLADVLEEHAEELAQLESVNVGQPLTASRDEMPFSANNLAGYWNSGQDCTAGSRVLAGPKIYDSLLEELVPQVESLRVGDPLSDETARS